MTPWYIWEIDISSYQKNHLQLVVNKCNQKASITKCLVFTAEWCFKWLGFAVGVVLSVLCLGTTPHPVTVTNRIILSLVGNPYKPLFATVTLWFVGGRSNLYLFLASFFKLESLCSLKSNNEFVHCSSSVLILNTKNVTRQTSDSMCLQSLDVRYTKHNNRQILSLLPLSFKGIGIGDHVRILGLVPCPIHDAKGSNQIEKNEVYLTWNHTISYDVHCRNLSTNIHNRINIHMNFSDEFTHGE